VEDADVLVVAPWAQEEVSSGLCAIALIVWGSAVKARRKVVVWLLRNDANTAALTERQTVGQERMRHFEAGASPSSSADGAARGVR